MQLFSLNPSHVWVQSSKFKLVWATWSFVKKLCSLSHTHMVSNNRNFLNLFWETLCLFLGNEFFHLCQNQINKIKKLKKKQRLAQPTLLVQAIPTCFVCIRLNFEMPDLKKDLVQCQTRVMFFSMNLSPKKIFIMDVAPFPYLY